jgi:hypothetical protein
MEFSLVDEISKMLVNEKDTPRDYVGASSIGNHCERKVWYQYKGVSYQCPSTLKITFEIGRRLEAMIIDYLSLSNIKIIRPTSENPLFCFDKDLPSFSGHMDALIELSDGRRAILEIKTAKASSYAKFANPIKGGVKNWNPQYYSQIQSYMGMTGIHDAVFFVINKDSSECQEEWVKFNSLFYDELKVKATRIIDSVEEPERINKNPIFYLCQMCGYKEKCHG